MEGKNWFEVDVKGLRALQAGKPKYHVLREIVQNAWDENITECSVTASFSHGICTILVKDDCPEGFSNIRDSFTLFGDTKKRRDVSKRGRFNLGEKQVISLCSSAVITTTKGEVIFKEDGRHHTRKRTEKGSEIWLKLRMTNEEFDEMLAVAKSFLPPEGIRYVVNDEVIPHQKPYRVFEETLQTQFEVDGVLRETQRKTEVHVLKQETSYLYEMGLPVVDIECPYSIDVQQKVPMSVDRESVKPSYLRRLFALVLNSTIDDIGDEESSETWIRTASSDKMIAPETMEKLVEKRFGDKVVVANPNDPVANDEALANGFRVIQGRELSKEEWEKVRENNLISSSTVMFGKSGVATDVKDVTPTPEMVKVGILAQRIAKRFLGIDVSISFIWSRQLAYLASYCGKVLTFNTHKLGNRFFSKPVSAETIDIIVHELGHEKGHHTEENYHKAITKMAGELTMTALNEPEFFREAV